MVRIIDNFLIMCNLLIISMLELKFIEYTKKIDKNEKLTP